MALGFIEQHPFKSQALEGNRLDDPTERLVTLYLPPNYRETGDENYPTIYLLASHGNTGRSYLNWRAWGESMEQRLDRLMSDGNFPPAIIVMPDMWTKLGGSQYLNSAIGNYEDYLIQEIIPFIDSHYRTNGKRGVMGHSSGGYGALVQAMRHPDVFMATASHSGDMYWEFTCLPDLAKLDQRLKKYSGIDTFIRDADIIEPKNGTFWETLMTVCWAMAHGTNPEAELGFDYPLDPETGALNEEVWQKWLAFDPIRMLDQPHYQTALRQLRLIYVAAGRYDEHQAQIGARVFSQKLTELGINHIHEEHDINHSGSAVPYDRSLIRIIEALTSN